MSTNDQLGDVLRQTAAEAVRGSSLLVEEVIVTAAGRRSVVRIVVDRDLGEVDLVTEPSEPLSLDEVADATRAISAALDEADPLGQNPYTLEVTSPGVGRPLTAPRHFQRAVGRLLRVVSADAPVIGRLTSAGPLEFVLEVPSTKKVAGGPRIWRYADIDRAEVQVEFNRPDPHVEE